MPPDKNGANGSDSPTDKNGANGTGSLPVEEVMAENKRKADEISKLKAQLEDYKADAESRIEELEEKSRLTRGEENELASLKDQVSQIKADKRSMAWREVTREDAKETFEKLLQDKPTVQKILHTVDLEYAQDMTDEFAVKEEMTRDQFEESILPYLRRFSGKPTTKLKKAYAAMLEDRAVKEKLKILESGNLPREIGGRAAALGSSKAPTLDEAKKKGNFAHYLKQVAENHERQATGKQ